MGGGGELPLPISTEEKMEIITRKEAKEQGLTRYYTGKPCKYGHVSERYMLGKCVACSKHEKKHGTGQRAKAKAKGLVHFSSGNVCKVCNTDKKYVSSGDCVSCHQRKGKAAKKVWREKNRDYYLAQAKEYRERTRQHRKEYAIEYRARTVERRAHYNKKHRRENAEYYREYRKRYMQEKPYINAAHQANRRSIKIKATPKWADHKAIKAVYEKRDRLRNKTGQDYHVDHIVPLIHPNVCGLHVPWNLQVITAEENMSKSNKLELR